MTPRRENPAEVPDVRLMLDRARAHPATHVVYMDPAAMAELPTKVFGFDVRVGEGETYVEQVRHLHWSIVAYRAKDAEGHMADCTEIDVVAGDYDEAFDRAAKLVPLRYKGTKESGAGYYLRAVTAYDDVCKGVHRPA